MRAIMAFFAGFLNLYESLNALIDGLKDVGFEIPVGIKKRITVINRVRDHLGEPNEEGGFPSCASRVRIMDASNEIAEIISLVQVVEIDFYRSEVVRLLGRCEELLPVLSIQDKVLDLKNQIRVTGKYKIDQLPLEHLRKRFGRQVKELRELELQAAEIAVRETFTLMNTASKPVQKKGRAPHKREMDRRLRLAMKTPKGQKSGGNNKSRVA